MPRRTAEEVIAMGLDAIGDQIELLVAGGEKLEGFDQKALCDYVKAACAVHKDEREADLHDKIGELNDADLEKLLVEEAKRDPALLRRIIAQAKVDLGRAS